MCALDAFKGTARCHAERSEASLRPSGQTLRGVYTERSECAQGDTVWHLGRFVLPLMYQPLDH
jgi:hypothetical protein